MRFGVALLAAAVLAYAPAGCAQEPPSLVGSWRLVSFESRYENGDVKYPLGQQPLGRLSYDAAGNMSALLVQAGRPEFAGGDMRGGTDAEVRAAFEGFIGYFGTYSVDPAKGIVSHRVQGAAFPNWIGGGAASAIPPGRRPLDPVHPAHPVWWRAQRGGAGVGTHSVDARGRGGVWSGLGAVRRREGQRGLESRNAGPVAYARSAGWVSEP